MQQKRRLQMAMVMVWVTTFALVNCGGSSTKRFARDSPFPKQAVLEKIKAEPVDASVLADEGKVVERWELLGPLPDQIGMTPASGGDAWQQLAIDAVASANNAKGMVSQAMDCAARELGNFQLQQGDSPSRSLSNFIRRRCGALSSQVSTQSWTIDLDPGERTEMARINAESIASIRESIRNTVAQHNGPIEVGLWFGQQEGKAIIQLATGRPILEMAPLRMTPDQSGALTLTGRLFSPAVRIGAMVTTGDFGAERCVVDTRVALPDFQVTCPVNAADPSSVIAISREREGSVFSEQLFDQMIWPAGVKSAVYEAPRTRQILRAVSTDGLSGPDRYLAYVNGVRQAAGVPPLKLAPQQSLSANALTPHLFQAFQDDDDDSANKIIMGLLAGWDVPGEIVDGGFYVTYAADGQAMTVLDNALESPGGRHALLDKDGGIFAVGERVEGDHVGATLFVYEFLPDEKYVRRLARAWRTINHARKLEGKSQIKRSAYLLRETETLSAQVQAGKLSYDEAVETLANRVAMQYNSGVQYFTYFTHDLANFDLHPLLLDAQSAEAVVMVTPLRPDGYPWTIFAVNIILPQNRLKTSSKSMAAR